jgi:hypothetical protein
MKAFKMTFSNPGPGPGTGTDTQADPTVLPPFIPGNKDDLPNDLNFLPKLDEARLDEPDFDGDVWTVKIPVSVDANSNRQITDYGYLVFVGDDQNIAAVLSLLNYPSLPNNPPVLRGVLIATTSVRPTRIKVTVLSKKEVSIQRLV